MSATGAKAWPVAKHSKLFVEIVLGGEDVFLIGLRRVWCVGIRAQSP